ncbi:MAG: GFA family protein [Candidatus Dadabacteria bacterium]|nr:GFA family protein [Candidatus Dadabacteria bacterium]NIV42098.1 GFA family protein [Candidatus Dadabacteria bacterium]NIX16427.1 GFA family protein [Candidatus Dadabacteria bacterium]
MKLEGSCHCKAVKFSVQSLHPYPYMYCYCSICRKTAGGGGYAINLNGDYSTLKIEGKDNITVYQAYLNDKDAKEDKKSPAERSFCSKCGSSLWVWDPRWPEQVHLFASAVDTDLPKPPEKTHIMLDYKAGWVDVHKGSDDMEHPEYPDESIAGWHKRLGLEDSSD